MITTARRRILAIAAVAFAWSVQRVGLTDLSDVVNGGGLDAFARFWSAVLRPDLSLEFLRLTVDATLVTIAFATLGTVVALIIGVVGSVALAESVWPTSTGRMLRRVATGVFVVPRAIHEIVWAIVLLQVFGFDPLVAIVAIGIPFGAVTAKVFAETLDEADQEPYRLARAAGATRVVALLYGTVPQVAGELVSYAFYRLECAVRSAAVVGIVGLGGLGFQLELSFQSLRYEEIWTLIAALMLVSGLADQWSTRVRRSRHSRTRRRSVVAGLVLITASWWWVGPSIGSLWSERTRRRAAQTADDLWPPTLGPDGWDELIAATLDTAAMSIVALVIASVGGVALGAMAARPTGDLGHRGSANVLARTSLGVLLLLCRAVPAPLWAFIAVLVLFPGPLPGAAALGVYNIGVVGRLVAEVFEERPSASHDLSLATGATRVGALVTVRLPEAAGRVVAVVMYRWEVIVRETIVVGVVGAGGLGQLLNEHRAARDLDAVAGTIVSMVVLAVIVDQVSRSIRRSLRIGGGPDIDPAPRSRPTRVVSAT